MKRPDFFDYDSITDYRIDLNNYCDYLEKNNKKLIESVEALKRNIWDIDNGHSYKTIQGWNKAIDKILKLLKTNTE